MLKGILFECHQNGTINYSWILQFKMHRHTNIMKFTRQSTQWVVRVTFDAKCLWCLMILDTCVNIIHIITAFALLWKEKHTTSVFVNILNGISWWIMILIFKRGIKHWEICVCSHSLHTNHLWNTFIFSLFLRIKAIEIQKIHNASGFGKLVLPFLLLRISMCKIFSHMSLWMLHTGH